MQTPAETQSLYKFGNGAAEDRHWTYDNIWAVENGTGTRRLIVAPSNGEVGLIEQLLEAMPEPMWLLYVLIVPRGEGEAGRYQSSEPQTREQVKRLLCEFRRFLEGDGRQSLWIHCTSGAATLVYDSHNLIYLYGLESEFRSTLLRAELTEVDPASVAVPYPHSHHYHAAFDSESARLLTYMNWNRTPLREQDED